MIVSNYKLDFSHQGLSHLLSSCGGLPGLEEMSICPSLLISVKLEMPKNAFSSDPT